MVSVRTLAAACAVLAACRSSSTSTSDAPAGASADAGCTGATAPARRLLYVESPEGGRNNLDAITFRTGEAPCAAPIANVPTAPRMPVAVSSGGVGAFVRDTGVQLFDLRGGAPALGQLVGFAGTPPALATWQTAFDVDVDATASPFSPDGQTVAALSGDSLFAATVTADGGAGDVRTLVAHAAAPSWAPTGARVLALVPTATPAQVLVIDSVSGTTQTWTAPTGFAPNASSVWSPDGRWVAISLITTGSVDVPDLVMLADTMHPERGLLTTVPSPTDDCSFLDWSPDSSRVAVGCGGTVHVVTADDAAPTDAFDVAQTAATPARMPDATHVLAQTDAGALVATDAKGATVTVATSVPFGWHLSPDHTTVELVSPAPALVPATGGAAITPGCTSAVASAWTADGASFACVEGDASTAYVVTNGVTRAIPLPTDTSVTTSGFASWSPDGAELFVSRGTRSYVVDATTGTATAVSPAAERAAAWQTF